MPPRKSFERIGHRGAPLQALENTIPSFLRAFEWGPCAVELDVHGTADGVVVVHHDPRLPASVSPAGASGREIATMSWKELSEVELASGVGIPTLAAVLAATPTDSVVYVEIKGSGIEGAVADVIKASNRRCAVHAFDHSAIGRLRNLAPEIPRGLLFDSYPSDVGALMREMDASDVWPDWRLIDRPLVESVHEQGGRVIAWTVNTVNDAEALLEMGVDALCTDDLWLFAIEPESAAIV